MSAGVGDPPDPADKPRLREDILARRDALASEWRAEADRVITDRLLDCVRERGANHLMAYSSFRSEWPSREFNAQVLAAGCTLYLPRVDRQTKRLAIHRVDDLDRLRPGIWQIPEPDPATCAVVTDLNVLDLILVPGIAFDARGGRLGYGGGFYDKLLVDATRAFRLVGAYGFQVVAAVPMEAHDQRVDRIVTEAGVWSVSRG